MSVRFASRIGRVLGLALIATTLVSLGGLPARADQFRGGHFVGHPFFHRPFFRDHDFFRDRVFFRHRFFFRDPRFFVGVGPVYPYPYPYAHPYPYAVAPPGVVVYP